MKQSELRQIIREEISKVLREASGNATDAKIAAKDAQDRRNAKTFVSSPQGKNAVDMLKKLISKPYTYDKLDDVLQILNLDKKKFMYAADAAGMEYSTSGAGIRIFDKNYKNKNVSIDYQNGKWYVG